MGGARLAALLLLLGAARSGRAEGPAEDGSSAATVAAMMFRRLEWTWDGAALRGLGAGTAKTVDNATSCKFVTDSRGGSAKPSPAPGVEAVDDEPDSYKPGEPGGDGAPCRIDVECLSARCQLYRCAASVDAEAVANATNATAAAVDSDLEPASEDLDSV